MRCPHCNTANSTFLPFDREIEGGRAFAQTCTMCGCILGIRPHVKGDPPAAPPDLDRLQIERLRFVQWRLRAECSAQVRRSRARRRATAS